MPKGHAAFGNPVENVDSADGVDGVDTVDDVDAFRPAMSCLQNNAIVLPTLVRCESKKSRQHRHAATDRTSSDSCATLETTWRHPISVNPVNGVSGVNGVNSRHEVAMNTA